jgi:phage shock protein C
MSNEEPKRLTKSRANRMIDGVCSGIAHYAGIDPTLIRLLFVLMIFLGGLGVVLYIVGMIIMPTVPAAAGSAAQSTAAKPADKNTMFWGFLLIGVGIIWIMSNLGFALWHHWWSMPWGIALPTLLILAGVAFLFGGRNSITTPSMAAPPEAAPEPATAASLPPHRLFRSRKDKKLAGVCGGLGEYTNVDPTIVRILFIVAGLASFGFTILVYIVMAIVVPKDMPAVQQS